MTPLDEFVARWTYVDMPIPFVEVVNTQVQQENLPALWASAMLMSDRRADVSLGDVPWVEEGGTIVVGLFARSGTGRSGLDTATRKLREFFHGYSTTDESLTFTAVIGPEEIDPEADGGWWRLGFTIPFLVQDQRVEPLDVVDAWAAMLDFHQFVHFELGQ